MKKNSKVILLIVSVICILDTIFIAISSGGVDTGILLPAIGGVAVIFSMLFTKSGVYKRKQKTFIRLGKIIGGLFIVWLISFAVVSGIIIASAVSDEDQQTDSVLVLGAGVNEDKPTLVLEERLNYAIEYLKANPDSKVIVSGGQGFGEKISEAEAMKRYLVEHGVAENIIVKEDKSTSTYENMIYSKAVYEKTFGSKLNRVLLVTSDFHMFRSKFLAKRVGLEPYGISSATPWYISPNVYLREYLAIFKSLILDR